MSCLLSPRHIVISPTSSNCMYSFSGLPVTCEATGWWLLAR